MIALAQCPGCGSRLLRPVEVVGPVRRYSIVARHCPECDLRDTVAARDIAIRLWLLRERKLRMQIADALAASRAAPPAPPRP